MRAAGETHSQQGAAVLHHSGGAFGDFGEGEAGDHQRANEIFAAGVGVKALELAFIGIADGMNDKVEFVPLLFQPRKHRVDCRDILDVARQHDIRAELGGEGGHAFQYRLALVGEAEFGAVLRQGARNSVGDRMVVGDPHDEAAFSLHQTFYNRHLGLFL